VSSQPAFLDAEGAARRETVIKAGSGTLDETTVCVMCVNAHDPVGAGGLSADTLACGSVGVHALPVVATVLLRDTTRIFDQSALDRDVVEEQASALAQDIEVAAIKAGFLGNAENVAAVSEFASDYEEMTLVAYMPDVSWLEDAERDAYWDAFEDLLLPQAAVLVGHHATLTRWLLPDWEQDKPPSARDIARAAASRGTPYVLATGWLRAEGDTHRIETVLATAETTLANHRFEHIGVSFIGAGDTLSAALTGLLASGMELSEAVSEALTYLDGCLERGFPPGMGHVVPDRLFWGQTETETEAESAATVNAGDTDTAQHEATTETDALAAPVDTSGRVALRAFAVRGVSQGPKH
jgi:hydroxymethylpyrimidine/phosphomethylpyrimidine kinase